MITVIEERTYDVTTGQWVEIATGIDGDDFYFENTLYVYKDKKVVAHFSKWLSAFKNESVI